jgi:anti-sigma B factor antagonist
MPTTNLTLNIREVSDGIRVIDVIGEITSFSEKEISEAHQKAGDGATAVILNFEGLDYMNSGGIGLLVTTLIRAQR